MKNILFFFLLITVSVSAQELDCSVVVNTQQINQSNQKIFKNLEKNLQEFVNRTQWTSLKVLPNEKITSAITLTITSFENNQFVADLQIQATRPIFGSIYTSNLLNFREKGIQFPYLENEPLFFNTSTFTSEITSIIAYYIYIIIGIDADSFAILGGTPYFQQAFSVVQNAQSSSDMSWKSIGQKNRWQLINDLLSTRYSVFREAFYSYHRLGLDNLHQNSADKDKILEALYSLQKIQTGRLNDWLLQLFFDAKTDEIVSLFSEEKSSEKYEKLKKVLLELSPSQSDKWQKIK